MTCVAEARRAGRSPALGVGTVFGVVGSGNFHVTNALVAAGARFVAARHEGGAATMADAYARSAAGSACVSVHQGRGLTNAMTGITEAAKSRTPLLVLAAETGDRRRRSNFRVDQAALATAVGAVPMRVPRAGDRGRRHRRALPRRAAQRAAHRRAQPAAGRAGQPPEPAGRRRPPAPPPAGAAGRRPMAAASCADAARGRAERPVFVAGRGAPRGPAGSLEALAERTRRPARHLRRRQGPVPRQPLGPRMSAAASPRRWPPS